MTAPVDDPRAESVRLSSSQGRTNDERPDRPAAPPAQGAWGGLDILEEIGRGGFGRVYRAWEPTLAREVALKIISVPEDKPTAVSAILREGQLLARVRHPNVVTIHGAQQIRADIGLWMEFVRGRTLTDIVRGDGPRAAGEAALVGVTLCQALAAVHQTGIVHRDIKAHNVMREAGGRLVLMDFGAGQVLAEPGTLDAQPAGTPLYMAPEVLAGSRATIRSDIYGLGILLYYLVTGRYPVEGCTWTDLLMAHARFERRHLADARPDLPPRFVRVVERATAANPEDRYATPGAMLRDLGELTAGEGGTTEIPTFRAAPAARTPAATVDTTKAWNTAGVAAALVLGIGVLGVITTAAYNNTLGRSGDFARESLLAQWIWGLRSLVAGSIQIAVVVMMWWLLRSAWKLIARVPPLARVQRSASRYAATLARRTGLADADAAAHALLAAQIVAVLLFCWFFFDLFSAAFTMLDQASPRDVEPLRPAHLGRHQLFNLTMAMLLLAMSLGARAVVRQQRASGGTARRGPFVAIFLVMAGALISVVLPYRLIWHNRVELVTYQSHHCYVIGEANADLLLYCPSAPIPKTMVVPRNDSHLERSRVIESFYTR